MMPVKFLADRFEPIKFLTDDPNRSHSEYVLLVLEVNLRKEQNKLNKLHEFTFLSWSSKEVSARGWSEELRKKFKIENGKVPPYQGFNQVFFEKSNKGHVNNLHVGAVRVPDLYNSKSKLFENYDLIGLDSSVKLTDPKRINPLGRLRKNTKKPRQPQLKMPLEIKIY